MSKLTTLALSSIFPLIFANCGGSSTPSTTTATTQTAIDEKQASIGYYIDSKISGVAYRCGSYEGITGSNGEFEFEQGKGCQFFINDVSLRQTDASLLTHGVEIIEDNLYVAQLIQSLDMDANSDNGIQITQEVLTALQEDVNFTRIPQNEQEIQNIISTLQELNISNFNGQFVSRDNVYRHLNTTLLKKALQNNPLFIVDEGQVVSIDISNDLSSFKVPSNVTNPLMVSITLANSTIYLDDSHTLILQSLQSDYALFTHSYPRDDGEMVSTEFTIYFNQAAANSALYNATSQSLPWNQEIEEVTPIESSVILDPELEKQNNLSLELFENRSFYFMTGHPLEELSYIKFHFNPHGSLQINIVAMDQAGEVSYTQSYLASYFITDNKLMIDNEQLVSFKLLTQNASSFKLLQNNEDANTNYQRIWYFSKPSHFPAEL